MDDIVENATKKEATRFSLRVEDLRRAKDASQQFALSERLKGDRVDEVLDQTYRFFGEYAAHRPQELNISLVDGKVGEGTINGTVIELQLPESTQASSEIKSFTELFLAGKSEEDKGEVAEQLVTALTVSTALHEGVHGLLNSKPDSKFSADFEAITGFPNEQGRASTLLDEGIAYAIQGIYAPDVELIGSLAPVAKEADERLVKQRKILGYKLRPVVKRYIDSGKSVDASFFELAKEAMIDMQTSEIEIQDRNSNL
jgi:hypothetical protein